MAKKSDTPNADKVTADDLPYRPCVGIALFNADGLVWMGNRFGFEGAWQLPQGGIDDGETPIEAAMRELKEEIGTDKAEIISETPNWLTYDLPEHLIGKAFKGKYRGQKQKWFAMRFVGDDADINIATETPEFVDWRWEDINRLPELIVPFKRRLYQGLISEFGHLAETGDSKKA